MQPFFNAAASGSHNAAEAARLRRSGSQAADDADESGIGIGSSARASASSPSRCAQRQIDQPRGAGTVVPRKKPASIAEPPVGSASISNTGRGQVNAKPNADVVTPSSATRQLSRARSPPSVGQRSRESRHHGDLAGRGARSQLSRLVVGHLNADHRLAAIRRPDTPRQRWR